MTSPEKQAITEEDEEFLEVMSNIDDELAKNLIIGYIQYKLKAQAEVIFKEMGDISMKSPRIVEKGYLRLRKKYIKEE